MKVETKTEKLTLFCVQACKEEVKEVDVQPLKKEKTFNSNRDTYGQKTIVVALFIGLVCVLFYVNATIKGGFNIFLGIYGSIMVTYMVGKMALSFWYNPKKEEPIEQKISAIIPCYNESPESVMATVDSLLKQDYPIEEIMIIDDGSKDISAYKAMVNFKKEYEKTAHNTALIVHRLEKNQGKRHAQIWGFKRAKGNIIATVDSDAYLFPDAIRELIKPFNDEKVMATTGHVGARNRADSLFTRLIDMRYDNAFRVERSAQSVTGNILVCSGCFSAYRTEVILENIEHYENQMFLGEPVQFGDDRCLTNYAILKGKTIYQSTARCITDVPSTLRQFIKQQVRWNKSFFRESLIALKIGFKKPRTLIWVLLELIMWFMFGFVIIGSIIIKSATMGYILLVYYLFYLSLSAYARNVFYVLRYPHIFLLAPIYGLIHICILYPLRLYALATIKSNGWGTR
jgi:hyaluronan synthase